MILTCFNALAVLSTFQGSCSLGQLQHRKQRAELCPGPSTAPSSGWYNIMSLNGLTVSLTSFGQAGWSKTEKFPSVGFLAKDISVQHAW